MLNKTNTSMTQVK